MKRIYIVLIAGVLMVVLSYLTGSLFQAVFPSLALEYSNQGIFRTQSDPLMMLFFITPFITALILSKIWNVIKPQIKGESFVNRGLSFAALYWLITIPGMIMSYSSFQVSFLLVTSWTIQNLLQAMCAGLVYARLQP